MNEIMAISNSLWKRILGEKVVYFLVFCAIALIAITNLYDVLMVGEHKALMVDSAFFLIVTSAILTVISLAFDIPKELNSGVASVLLAKPLGRSRYLIGKLVGISIAGLIVTGLISIGFLIVYSMVFEKPSASLMTAVFLACLSVIPMGSIVVLFASFMQEAAAAIISFIVIWFSFSTSHVLGGVKVLYGGIFADLGFYNMGAEGFYNLPIGFSYILFAILSAALTAITMVTIANIIFNSRDL